MGETEREREERIKKADELIVDWYEDVIHARHIERTGHEPPAYMRAGWPDPFAKDPDPQPVDEDLEQLDEDELEDLDDDFLVEDVAEMLDWFD